MDHWRLALSAVLLLLGACTRLPGPSPSPGPALTPTSTTAPVPPTETAVPTPGPITLRVWVPPQFDPGADTRQADLLSARLEEFTRLNPDIRVDVRLKATEGEGGLLASLTAAHAVAPRALPDLIALPQDALETAAIKGLLHPITARTSTLVEEDWYEYARQLIRLQTDDFGLPFAGDALILVYRPSLVSEPPGDWKAALQITEPLSFPAASPNALFPLTLYLASGGSLQDDQGRPTLDVETLTAVLNLFQSGERTGLTPVWLTQYNNLEQAWQTFLENRAHLTITWTSRYLAETPPGAAPASLPTPDGVPYTLATGWVWALASSDEDRLDPGVRLAEFLTERRFLGEWTAAAGYLPPRAGSLQAWPGTAFRALISEILDSATVVPPREILTSLGPVLQQAMVDVLKGQATPAEAAEEAAARVGFP